MSVSVQTMWELVVLFWVLMIVCAYGLTEWIENHWRPGQVIALASGCAALVPFVIVMAQS